MTLSFLPTGARHRHRIPRDMPPPWPDRPRLPFHPLW